MVTLTHTDIDENITILELPNPEQGNSHSIEVQRAVKLLRDQNEIVVRDSDWGTDRVQRMRFSNLSAAKANELDAFLEISLGEEMVMLDWLADTYNVTLLNPETSFVTEGRGSMHSAELIFAGARA